MKNDAETRLDDDGAPSRQPAEGQFRVRGDEIGMLKEHFLHVGATRAEVADETRDVVEPSRSDRGVEGGDDGVDRGLFAREERLAVVVADVSNDADDEVKLVRISGV